MSSELAESLTKGEQRRYDKACVTIQKGLSAFYIEVGAALKVIRDDRLYREDHATFEAFCRAECDMARSTVYQIIDASVATENVRNCGQSQPILPATESQARPLTHFDTPEEQSEAWARVVETAPTDDAGNPKITAKHVAAVVEEMTADPEPEPDPGDEPTGMHDYRGDLVPEAIEDNFDEEDTHTAIGHIIAARSTIQAIGKRHAGDYLDHKELSRTLLAMRRAVEASAMYALCPECNGARCLSCSHAGSVPEAAYLQMTEDER